MIDSSNYKRIYKDIDFDFKKNEISNDIKTRLSTSAISQSIKNIILTSKKEKPFNSRYWFGLYEYLFSNKDSMSTLTIASVINEMEPRVTVGSNDVSIVDSGSNSLTINIKYKIKSPVDTSLGNNQTLTITISGEDDGR